MKKISGLLIAAILTTLLAACGSNNEEGDLKKTENKKSSEAVQVAWWGNQTRNERTQQALELYAKEHEGIEFDGQFSEWNDYWQKLATASAGKNLPDVIQMDYLYLDQYIKNGLLEDLTPYVENGTLNLDDVDPNIIESGMVDGKLYSVSIGTNAPALIYNKAVTDAADVEIKDNMTLDEFIDVSKKIQEKTGYKTNMAFGVSQEILQYMVRSTEGSVLFGDGKLGVKSADEFVPFFEIYEKGIKEGWHLSPEIYAETTAAAIEQDPLVYGSGAEVKSWCQFGWSNQYVGMCNAAPEDAQLELTTWPAEEPKKSNFLKPSQLFSVSTDAKNPETGVKLIDFWTNSKECNEILLGERGVPVSEKVAEEISGLLSDQEKKTVTYVNDVVQPNASKISPPYPEGSAEVSELINQLTEQVGYGEITAKQAADKLFTSGNDIMAKDAK